jgi:integrase
MARLSKTSTPGVFRRHVKDCDDKGRCECSYAVVWRHRGKQSMETFATFAEAREAKGKRAGGESRPTSKVRFEDYFTEWIESYAGRTARGFSETSRSLYRRSINDHALRRWRGWKLAEIEARDVRTLYADLRAASLSTSGVRSLRAALSALFATAVEDGLVRSNPLRGVRIPAPRSTEPADDHAKALTREELRVLLAAIPHDWRLFFEFLAHTGLRISEAIGLQWRHVEVGRQPRILVREQLCNGERHRLKSGAAKRDIPLSLGMSDRLRAHRRDTYGGDRTPLFATSAGTELNRPNVAGRVLKPAARAAGLTVDHDSERVPWVSFHTFRHTCASLLFEQGRNVKQVADWLGHSDPSFTLRTYVHLLDAGVGDADFLDSAVKATNERPAHESPSRGRI